MNFMDELSVAFVPKIMKIGTGILTARHRWYNGRTSRRGRVDNGG
jgi:hypothetical protein